MSESQPQGRVLRPRARKPFELSPPSAESSAPGTPNNEVQNPDFLTTDGILNANKDKENDKENDNDKDKDGLLPSNRTHSELNLTGSTLLGIYGPTAAFGSRGDSGATPWGTGAQTPSDGRKYSSNGGLIAGSTAAQSQFQSQGHGQGAQAPPQSPIQSMNSERRRKQRQQHGFKKFVLPLIGRCVLLFAFGVAYGTIIMHLHGNPRVRGMMPVWAQMDSLMNSESWEYLVFWGVAGVALGNLLPWFDVLWVDFMGGSGDYDNDGDDKGGDNAPGSGLLSSSSPSSSRWAGALAADWNPVVRSVGAFIGIAFAIRKTPWQSTLQVSLTLALVNPFLWYLVDRSKSGFVLSTLIGITGMLALLEINPEIVSAQHAAASSPSSPSTPGSSVNGSGLASDDGIIAMGISHGDVAVATWIASVLFCSCVCFGNIGRRLASS